MWRRARNTTNGVSRTVDICSNEASPRPPLRGSLISDGAEVGHASAAGAGKRPLHSESAGTGNTTANPSTDSGISHEQTVPEETAEHFRWPRSRSLERSLSSLS